MEGWRRWCLGAVALMFLVVPTGASARRDDPPVEGRAPADGAVVKDAVNGLLSVRFTCPPYHPTAYDEVVDSAGTGYHVILATAGAVGVDGLLLGPSRVDARDAVTVDDAAGMCTAAPDTDERGLLPREPGTYWWQAYRDCATYLCPFGTEVSEPMRVVVRETVCTANRTALGAASQELAAARKAYRSRRTEARRDRVTRLAARVTQLKARLRAVYHCKM